MMRFASIASVLLSILSFLAGSSFLILFGAYGALTSGAGFLLDLVPFALIGGVLVFLAFPIALYGFNPLPRWIANAHQTGLNVNSTQNNDVSEVEAPLLSNKLIVGISLVITGVDWIVLILFALYYFTLSTACPYPGCRYIFSSLATLLIGIGVLIIALGIVLIVTSLTRGHSSSREQSNMAPVEAFEY